MHNLNYVQVENGNPTPFELFKGLMVPYIQEIDTHHPEREATSTEIIAEYTQSMIRMQGPVDRHLELCFDGDRLIGFYCARVDHEGQDGFGKPGYCYIMEFYVLPEHRHKGYGQAMFQRIIRLYQSHDIQRIYLTADPVTGKPFWERLGFQRFGEISQENGQEIYEMSI